MSVGITQRQPALDGLRGVAIALVIAFHLVLAKGGWVGVNVFFVLSGYLITGLLLTEHRKTQTIRLPAFYRRRAARLAPALLVALLGMLLLWTAANQQAVALPRMLPALLYVANFALALRPQWSVTGWAWSLSLEEQFYMAWPLALRRLLNRGITRSRIARTLFLLSALLMLARALCDDFGISYALLRGDELMLGAAVALVPVVAPWLVTVLSVLALGFVAFTESLPHTQWAITLGTLAAVGLLTSRERLAPVLTVAPLRYLGRISYALYLWDGILVNAPLPNAWPHGASYPVTGAAIVLAVLSTHLLEEPLRRRLSGHREVVETDRPGVVPQPVLGAREVAGVRG